MSGSVFVIDHHGTPLMPMAPAYARRLLRQHKAVRLPHHAFTIIQLTRVVAQPMVRPLTLFVAIDLNSAELILVVQTRQTSQLLCRIMVDLRTDIAWRMRRRAGHRRRRRARGRYRSPRRYGRPFVLRRPGLAHSAWAKQHWQKRHALPRPRGYNAVVRWRVQAIQRVIHVLQRWLPVSAIVLFPDNGVAPYLWQSPHIAASAEAPPQQTQHVLADRARCAYCGAQDRRLVTDHLLPQSRGGSDAATNRVWACQRCNTAKGNRTPEEAEMQVRFSAPADPYRAHYMTPYTLQTRALFATLLRSNAANLLADMAAHHAALLAIPPQQHMHAPVFIAKPIGRPSKQQFTAHNYPLQTPPGGHFVRRQRVVKRRVRVNAGVAIHGARSRRTITVCKIGDHVQRFDQTIRLGMMCQAERKATVIVGIVTAIHSSGRITLMYPAQLAGRRILWARTVVSPRQAFRILSTDRIMFFPYAHTE